MSDETDTKLESERDPESETYCRVKFHCQQQGGTVTIHEADCGLETTIVGLKFDLRLMFNLPVEYQMWKLRDRVLEDKKTLSDYGLGRQDLNRNIIFVQRSSTE
ncbi:hypothetical protein Btru_035434 [Bulinus truncatus]|nr:hypothetical protein Btru_035434 [Bulinus truncatus]